MYEAPDRYKRLISARLPGGESAGLAAREAESESSPLRDVQLMSRAQLAPFFAAANIVAALMMVANLWDVIAGRPGCCRGPARSASSISARCSSRAPSRSPASAARAAACRSGCWSARSRSAPLTFLSLPLYLFPVARSRHPGHRRLGHGRPRRRRPRPRRRPAMRDGLDGRLHRRRRRRAAARPPHRSLPAHAVDPVHARRLDLRRADRRALGVPPAQDQRRRRQPEREREPAAPGI